MNTAAIAATTAAIDGRRRGCRRRCGSGEVAELEDAGGEDDRGGEQEAEPRGVGVVQAAGSPAAMTIPSRLIPAISAAVWATPITPASRYSSVSSSRPPSGLDPLAARPARGPRSGGASARRRSG